MTIIDVFIGIQIILLCIMLFHDWVHLPPLTDIRALEQTHPAKFRFIDSLTNGGPVLIALLLTWFYRAYFPLWVALFIVFIYALLTLGTIMAWWVPYLFGHKKVQWLTLLYGDMEEHKKGFSEYTQTHHFLPARYNNLVPNTLHVILHLHIWSCFVLSLYFLINR